MFAELPPSLTWMEPVASDPSFPFLSLFPIPKAPGSGRCEPGSSVGPRVSDSREVDRLLVLIDTLKTKSRQLTCPWLAASSLLLLFFSYGLCEGISLSHRVSLLHTNRLELENHTLPRMLCAEHIVLKPAHKRRPRMVFLP